LARFGETLYCLHQDAEGKGSLVALSFDRRWGDETVVAERALTSSPAAAVLGGRLYAVHQNVGNGRTLAFESTADGSRWTTPAAAPVTTHVGGSTAAATFGETLYVFYTLPISPVGTVAYVTCSASGSWGAERAVPGTLGFLTGTPGAAVFQERLYVCFPTSGRALGVATYDGDRWEAAQPVVGATGIAGGVSVVAFEGLLYALYRSTLGPVTYLTYLTFDGAAWHGPAQVAGVSPAIDPAATVY
ncbi:MAG TPA: hypothetical protein VFS37_01825, partial [Conexibacter sp.]|nr:hypothetical protein [Conexibacter sp.]